MRRAVLPGEPPSIRHQGCRPSERLGIGDGHPVLVTAVAAAVLAAVVVWLVRTHSPGVALCLAMVAGGAAGNLADRLLRSPGPGRGAAVDWIHVAGYPATFNLAGYAETRLDPPWRLPCGRTTSEQSGCVRPYFVRVADSC
jgi:hypothetical protein